MFSPVCLLAALRLQGIAPRKFSNLGLLLDGILPDRPFTLEV